MKAWYCIQKFYPDSISDGIWVRYEDLLSAVENNRPKTQGARLFKRSLALFSKTAF